MQGEAAHEQIVGQDAGRGKIVQRSAIGQFADNGHDKASFPNVMVSLSNYLQHKYILFVPAPQKNFGKCPLCCKWSEIVL